VTTVPRSTASPSLRDPPRQESPDRQTASRAPLGRDFALAAPPTRESALRAPLGREFYARPAVDLAQALLGRALVRQTAAGLCAGLIVEAEAYAGPDDRASHARAGRTRRTAPMFGPPGHAYVYLVYGMHSCLNVVSETDGTAGAVLLRALEPLVGLELIRARRGETASGRRADREGTDAQPPAVPHVFAEGDVRLCAGPARLCQALDIDRSLDGHDLTLGHDLWLADPDPAVQERVRVAGMVSGPRVGVGYAGPDWGTRPWRFGVRGHSSLSRPFPRGA
jgi:DNA-3-methyladenine glycosylase